MLREPVDMNPIDQQLELLFEDSAADKKYWDRVQFQRSQFTAAGRCF